MIKRLLMSSGCLFELIKGAVILAAILVLVNYFAATLLIVKGISMEPNYHDGEIIILDKLHYTFGKPRRGDVVGLRYPGSPDKRKFIKRIIGLPGEKVEINYNAISIDGKVLNEPYIQDLSRSYAIQEVIVPAGEYFTMGDNRFASSDSREWGTVPQDKILGRAWIKIWPLDQLSLIKQNQ